MKLVPGKRRSTSDAIDGSPTLMPRATYTAPLGSMLRPLLTWNCPVAALATLATVSCCAPPFPPQPGVNAVNARSKGIEVERVVIIAADSGLSPREQERCQARRPQESSTSWRAHRVARPQRV